MSCRRCKARRHIPGQDRLLYPSVSRITRTIRPAAGPSQSGGIFPVLPRDFTSAHAFDMRSEPGPYDRYWRGAVGNGPGVPGSPGSVRRRHAENGRLLPEYRLSQSARPGRFPSARRTRDSQGGPSAEAGRSVRAVQPVEIWQRAAACADGLERESAHPEPLPHSLHTPSMLIGSSTLLGRWTASRRNRRGAQHPGSPKCSTPRREPDG